MSKQERIVQIQSYLCDQFSLPIEQVNEMIPSFLITLSTHMENLENAQQADDLLALGRAGHTMKGALLNLGLNDCAEISMEIEERGKSGENGTDFAALVEDLRLNLNVLIS